MGAVWRLHGGVLNPLFGFISICLLLLNLHTQREELRRSTLELQNSAKALADQNRVLVRQNFDATFFRLLERIQQIVTSLRFDGSTVGRAALNAFHSQLANQYNNTLQTSQGLPNTQAVEKAYEKFYGSARGELGHYFRMWYHVISFIDRSDLSEREKQEYSNVARAQISSVELLLIFYNGTWGEGKSGYRRLIEKYGLLKHIDKAGLFDPSHIDNTDFYRKTAFLGPENGNAGASVKRIDD